MQVVNALRQRKGGEGGLQFYGAFYDYPSAKLLEKDMAALMAHNVSEAVSRTEEVEPSK